MSNSSHWGEWAPEHDYSERGSGGGGSTSSTESNRAWPYLVTKTWMEKLVTLNAHHHTAPVKCRLELPDTDRRTEHKQPGPLSTERDFFESETQYTIELLSYINDLKADICAMEKGSLSFDLPEPPVKKVKSTSDFSTTSSSGIIHLATKFAMLRKICSGSLMLSGFVEVESGALEILVDVLERYMEHFTRRLKLSIDETCETQIASMTTDVWLGCIESVFADFGIQNVNQLVSWYPQRVLKSRDQAIEMLPSLLAQFKVARSRAANSSGAMQPPLENVPSVSPTSMEPGFDISISDVSDSSIDYSMP